MNAMVHTWAILAAGFVVPLLKDKLHIDTAHVHGFHGLCLAALGVVLRSTWVKTEADKMRTTLLQTAKIVGPILLVMGIAGCSLSPQQIETDTAVAVNVGLQGATIFDRTKTGEIQTDAVTVAQAINSAVLPQFQPGATSGALLNSAVAQVVPHLQARLATLRHGQEILAVVGLLEAPLASALGGTASPTAIMSATARQNALAFFSGVSQGISAFTGNATLAPPPLPSMPVVPVAPAPAAPVPPAPTKP